MSNDYDRYNRSALLYYRRRNAEKKFFDSHYTKAPAGRGGAAIAIVFGVAFLLYGISWLIAHPVWGVLIAIFSSTLIVLTWKWWRGRLTVNTRRIGLAILGVCIIVGIVTVASGVDTATQDWKDSQQANQPKCPTGYVYKSEGLNGNCIGSGPYVRPVTRSDTLSAVYAAAGGTANMSEQRRKQIDDLVGTCDKYSDADSYTNCIGNVKNQLGIK